MVNMGQPDFLTGLAAKNTMAGDAAKYRELMAAEAKAKDIQYGAQLGAQEVVSKLPQLVAVNEELDYAKRFQPRPTAVPVPGNATPYTGGLYDAITEPREAQQAHDANATRAYLDKLKGMGR